MKKNEICRRTMDIIQINGFRQYVNFNTRISTTNASLIDFVVSDTHNISVTRLKKVKIGDHETIKINCEFFNVIKNAPKVLSFRDWKKVIQRIVTLKLNLTTIIIIHLRITSTLFM